MGRFLLIPRRLSACVLLLPILLLTTVSPLQAAAKKKKARPAPAPREAPVPEASSLAEALALASQRPPSGPQSLSIQIADLETGESVFQRNPDSP
ncbi:MAG TPA: hypothetical protein VGQ32_09295, partial [Thermoanaerobaculia bacterium]|nr:hypothetical protein [Thermoanaerobaculia bacterium]